MQVSALSTVALILLLASGAALADGAAILRCRQQVDPGQRFICYESIVVAEAVAAPVTRAAPTPPLSPSAEMFGLEQKATQGAVQSIDSRIPGRFYGWEPNEKILLANGQVWQISDDSRGALVASDPKVTVRRGALGAFYLDIAGTNRSPKVRRAK